LAGQPLHLHALNLLAVVVVVVAAAAAVAAVAVGVPRAGCPDSVGDLALVVERD